MIRNYILGFFVIFLPIFGISVLADSLFYEKLTIVPWNFIKTNVLEGHSQSFGADPPLKYLNVELPARFNIFFPCILFGCFNYTKDIIISKKQIPYLTIYCASILIFLSMLSHKEPKFLLPIFPPLFLIIGYYLATTCARRRPRALKCYVYFGVILEILINLYFVHLHELGAGITVMKWLRSHYPSYGSLITTNKFEGNYYSWNHNA